MNRFAIGLALLCVSVGSLPSQEPIVDQFTVFAENDGLLAVEAEHFFKQTSAEVRAFYLTHSDSIPTIQPDGDQPHIAGASGGAYLEILPDTRRTHDDRLIRGENFSPDPGKLAVLHYKVNISVPGRYYVWVRAHSTGPEDNGLHVGIDGQWPESGQRLQWCEGKQTWRWESKQRTEQVHCGEPYKIYLDIEQPGEHVIHFSMREDGFEFDKWLMTTDRQFNRPEDVGPESNVKSGKLPEPFPFVKPEVVDAAPAAPASTATATSGLAMPASMFAEAKLDGYYLDQDKWLAVNPESHQSGSAERTFPFTTGRYHVTLKTVGENDGKSSYTLLIDGEKIGDYTNPLGSQMFEEDAKFNKTWQNVPITEGAIIKVTSTVGSEDSVEYSRARWSAVAFAGADDATKALVAPLAAKQAGQAAPNVASARTTSPTKPVSAEPQQMPRQPHGDGSVKVSGERQTWHKITMDLSGPFAHEKDNEPNPFTDYRMTAHFVHADGTHYAIAGYFAADGNAGNSSADSGTVWRAHFAPDRAGEWRYEIAFVAGNNAALDSDATAQPLAPFDGASGKLEITRSDKQGRDLRAQGRLRYVGKHYLQFAESKQYFLKVGADAPETLLAYEDFDNTVVGNPNKAPLKSWSPHRDDWKNGDPTWGDGKGKGLIGAINYLSGKGCNAFSFLTYNAGGDGDNVWPFIQRDDKMHYDCSKLDQWGIVFDHGTQRGMYLHFKMQETENDDHRQRSRGGFVPESLDGGNLGDQRKLYCRELIARFGHNLALNWNLGEENTQSTEQQQAMINYIADLDAYDHNIVIHTFPEQQDQVYDPFLGQQSELTGVSLQNSGLESTHAETVKWVTKSAQAGKPWIVAFDESGSAAHAQCPDLGYRGFDGHDRTGKMVYTQHKVRKQTLWGTLMAGGAGNEYYFGYQFDENDIVCEDWRSRDQSWDYCRIAIGFFHDHKIPFWEMVNADKLVGNEDHGVSKFCFAKSDDTYLVYLPSGGTSFLDLSAATGRFNVHWFNPRDGGDLLNGSVQSVDGGETVSLGNPPADVTEDWLVVVRNAGTAATSQLGQSWQWENLEAVGLPTPRHEATMVAYKGKAYLIGGRRINPVDVYDPSTNQWTQKSETPIELHHFQAVVVGDAIYLMGAMTGPYPREWPLEKIVIYYPEDDRFEFGDTIPLHRRRGAAGAVYHNGKIYVVGGIVNGHIDGFQPWLDEYDPSTGQWKALADAPHARDHFQAIVLNDRLYACGGRTTSQATSHVFDLTVASIDVYDFQTQRWLPASDDLTLPTPRAGNMAAVWNNEIIIGGGESAQKTAHSDVESYDAASGQWHKWPSLQRGRHGSGFAIIGDYIYTASGSGNRGGSPELASIERLRLPRK